MRRSTLLPDQRDAIFTILYSEALDMSILEKVSIVIVSYNCKEDLKELIQHLSPKEAPYEIAVIDNNSDDGTKDMLFDAYGDYGNIKLIANHTNRGLTKANNQGIKCTSGEYVLLLNPDTIMEPDDIASLAEVLDTNPEIGLVGPKVVFPDGSLQATYGQFPSLLKLAKQHLLPSYKYFRNFSVVYSLFQEISEPRSPQQVDWVSIACCMFRRNVATEIGYLDEEIFLSYADSLDLAREIKQHDYEVWIYPSVEIVHKQGRSISDDIRFKTLMHAYQGYLYYFKKHSGRPAAEILRIIYITSSIEKSIISALLSLLNRDRYYVRAKTHAKAAVKTITLNKDSY